MSENSLILLILVGAVLLAFYLFDRHRREERRAEMAAFAVQRGWKFRAEKDSDFPETREHFALFAAGHSRAVRNAMFSRQDSRHGTLEVMAADYTYTTGSGKSSRTHESSLVFATLPFQPRPGTHLLIRPEGFADRLKAALGFDDIDFESEEFSRQYYVKSSDRRFAYDVVHPRMMEYLLRSPAGPLEVYGAEILLHHTDEEEKDPDELIATIEWLIAFVDLWPDFVVSQLSRSDPD